MTGTLTKPLVDYTVNSSCITKARKNHHKHTTTSYSQRLGNQKHPPGMDLSPGVRARPRQLLALKDNHHRHRDLSPFPIPSPAHTQSHLCRESRGFGMRIALNRDQSPQAPFPTPVHATSRVTAAQHWITAHDLPPLNLMHTLHINSVFPSLPMTIHGKQKAGVPSANQLYQTSMSQQCQAHPKIRLIIPLDP